MWTVMSADVADDNFVHLDQPWKESYPKKE